MNNRKKANLIHQKRNLQDRIKDNKTTEKYKEFKDWKKNPEKYDMKCVDDKKGIIFSFRNKDGKQFNMVYKDNPSELGKGYLHFKKIGKNEDIYIENIFVEPEHRNKCIANYLLREITNYLDKNCKIGLIVADPFDLSDKFDEEKVLENEKKLRKLYKSFGFKGNKINDEQIREPNCKIP